jgi:hypothetical protein
MRRFNLLARSFIFLGARASATERIAMRNLKKKFAASALIPVEPKRQALEPAFLTITATQEYLSLSQASVYRLLGLGRLEAKKAGGRTLVTMASIKRLTEGLPSAAIKAPTVRAMGA